MTARPSARERRDALVTSAFEEVAAKGLEGLRMRSIAAKAGIDHSSVHYHFATKEDLITAVIDHAVGHFRPVDDEGADAESRLRQRIDTLAALFRQRPDLFIVLRELDLRAKRDEAVAAVLGERDSRWRAGITAALAELDNGIDPAAGAELFIAAVKGASFAPTPDQAVAALRCLEQVLLQKGD